MELDALANVAQIASFVIPMVVFVALLWIRSEISKVQKEQQPNGGASLRDAVNRIEATQKTEALKLDSVIKDLATLRGSYDEHTKDSGRGNR